LVTVVLNPFPHGLLFYLFATKLAGMHISGLRSRILSGQTMKC